MRRSRSPLQQLQELMSAFFLQKCAPERTAKFMRLAREQWHSLVALNSGQFVLFVAELLYGHERNSLALRAHAFHCAVEWLHTATKVLTAGLLNQRPTASHTYGLRRLPILFEFASAGVVVLMSLQVGKEALLNLYFAPSPSEELLRSRRLARTQPIERVKFFWTVLPFVAFPLANWVLVWVAKRLSQRSARYNTLPSVSNPETSVTLLGCGAYGIEMKGRLLVVVGVALSICGALLAFTEWPVVDSLGSLPIIALIAPAVHSLLARSAPILLQKAPPGPRAAFDKACREVSTFEGVVQCSNEHFWMHAPGFHVASIIVSVRSTADKQELLKNIHNRFASSVTDLTVQMEDAEEPHFVDFAPPKHALPPPTSNDTHLRPSGTSKAASGSADAAHVEIVPVLDQHQHTHAA